jgi:hypothetical protein
VAIRKHRTPESPSFIEEDNLVVKGNLNTLYFRSPVITLFNYPFIKGRDKGKGRNRGHGGGA